MKRKRELAYILEWNKKIKAIKLLGGKCQECGEERPWLLTFHYKNPSKKEFNITDIKSYRWSLIEKEVKKCELLCHNCHHKRHFEETPQYEKRNVNKVIILQYVEKNCCEICGYDKSLKSLHFHHKDRQNKKIEISHYTNSQTIRSVLDIDEIVKEELRKCVLVCSNCHQDLHFDKEKFENYKEEIYNWKYKELKEPLDKELVIKLYNEGMRQIDIAKKFNRNKSVICSIIKRYTDV